ncbi:MAG: gliding motility-associated C-terminal domain-containing protein, partial [archaeon]
FNGKGMGYKTDEFELYIYDRWGEKIFYTNDPEKGWNGKMDGKDKVCMEGTYVYKFKVVELSGIEHKYIGIVLLLR